MVKKLRPFASTFILRTTVDHSVNPAQVERYNDENFTEYKSPEEFFPIFKSESMKYFNRIGIEKVYFVEALREDSEKRWDFPELLHDIGTHLIDKLNAVVNGTGDDPVDRAVMAASDPATRGTEAERICSLFAVG
eukprot:TRINITY_DN451_c1_g1_i1.p1 TRINITY_DN451_c1_g1~~TRINITY_DN451_c1_g1_i1.p1  ORF type:complete len:135 (-),score=22.16 TRINITY_DN451_c1_g1_i1:159-563(-)